MVKDFINRYNEYITAKSDYYIKDENIKENNIVLITAKKAKENSDFYIFDIVENYNFDEPSLLSSLLFFEELQQNSVNENWVAFAEYYGYDWYYTLDVNTGEVFLVDTNTNFIQLKCASSEENFIRAIMEVLNLEILRFKNNLKPIKSEIGEEYYDKCIELSEVENNNMFYRYILGV